MKATLLDHMGSDLTVVNAARVSFAKRSPPGYYNEATGLWEDKISEKDIKLIHYLASHGHWTPFGHPQLSFHIEAPIFVARQLAKHQVGAVWNEVSRRYVDEEPRFYPSPYWRERAEDKKQGSGEPVIPSVQINISSEYRDLRERAANVYRMMLSYGVCPEQARMVLPLATYTEWHWTGSLAFFARVAKLRLTEDTQKETRDLVHQMSTLIEPLFPHSWKALCQS